MDIQENLNDNDTEMQELCTPKYPLDVQLIVAYIIDVLKGSVGSHGKFHTPESDLSTLN